MVVKLAIHSTGQNKTRYDRVTLMADTDGVWTFNTTTKKITHQRNDNSRVGWQYDEGTQSGDNAAVGTLGSRASL